MKTVTGFKGVLLNVLLRSMHVLEVLCFVLLIVDKCERGHALIECGFLGCVVFSPLAHCWIILLRFDLFSVLFFIVL